ncbi:MAG: hypothetical protein D6765_09195, partial [Bacteroidetes bacterium]
RDSIEQSCGVTVLAPENLSAQATGPNAIHLEWSDRSDNESGFQLERSPFSNSNFSPIAQLPPNTTTYEDMGLVTNRRYFYRLKALHDTDPSFYSNEAEATPRQTTATRDFTFDGSPLTLQPNPLTDGPLRLRLDEPPRADIELALLSAGGRLLPFQGRWKKSAQTREFLWELPNLPPGVYFLRLRSRTHTLTLPLVKQ